MTSLLGDEEADAQAAGDDFSEVRLHQGQRSNDSYSLNVISPKVAKYKFVEATSVHLESLSI